MNPKCICSWDSPKPQCWSLQHSLILSSQWVQGLLPLWALASNFSPPGVQIPGYTADLIFIISQMDKLYN